MSVRTKLATIKLTREKFPKLVRLFDEDKQKYGDLIRPLMELAELAREKNYDEASLQYFRKPFGQVAKELIDAFFDMEGTMQLHGNKEMQALGTIYQQQIHPVHAAMVGKLRADKGKLSDTKEKFGIPASEFDVKTFMHKLMFYSYYSDLGQLASALSLNNVDITDKLKDEYFARLLPIQAVLEMQKREDIPVGRTVSKTGLFDVGLTAQEVDEVCPACQRFGTIYETKIVKGCKHCSAGFPKHQGDEYQL